MDESADGIDPFSGTIRDWHHSAKVRHDGASWTKRRWQHEKVLRRRRVGATARVSARRTEDTVAAAAQDGAAAAQEGAVAALGDAVEVAARHGCEAAQGGRRAEKEKKKIEPSRLYID
jgi:hypothetical protein